VSGLRATVAAAVVLAVVAGTGSDALGVAARKSTTFAGYAVSHSRHVNSAAAHFAVPTITCKSRLSGVGPAVILDSATNVFSGAGVGVACVHGRPVYQAVVIVRGAPHDLFALHAKDQVAVSVVSTRAGTVVSIRDLSRGKGKTLKGKGTVMSFAEIGVQGLEFGANKVGIDPFTPTTFTGATVNGKRLSKVSAYPVERVRGSTVQVRVGRLHSGTSFTVTFQHS
jgi:hypothetical protein